MMERECVCVCVCVTPCTKGSHSSRGSRCDITNLDQRSWVILRDVGLGQSHVAALFELLPKL